MRKSIIMAKQLNKIFHTSPTSSRNVIIDSSNILKNIAQNQGVASLSSIQLSYSHSILIILKPNILKNGKWTKYKAKQSDYNLFINPQITNYSVDEEQVWEECPSYPNLKLQMLRSKSILVKYAKQYKRMDTVEEELKKFQSILFQHQINHLKGQNLLKRAVDLALTQQNKNNQTLAIQLKEIFKNYKEHKQNLQNYLRQKNISNMQIDRIDISSIQNQEQKATIKDLKRKMDKNYKQLQQLIQYQIIDPVT